MMKITPEILRALPENTIFAAGVFQDKAGVNITGINQLLKFVALRGGVFDWAVYVGRVDDSFECVASFGSKISRPSALCLVDVSDEAKELYRD